MFIVKTISLKTKLQLKFITYTFFEIRKLTYTKLVIDLVIEYSVKFV